MNGGLPVHTALIEQKQKLKETNLLVPAAAGTSPSMQPLDWPLHDIVITNIVRFTAYKGGVGKRAYIAQWSCHGIAIA